MRIIGGRFRGVQLASVGKGDTAAHLRPTTDRVRESLFNVLAHGYGLENARVLDLFAGTGALGLEALSRGAHSVTFVDNGRKSDSLLAENIRKLRIESEVKSVHRDATKLGNGTAHDVVFLDPPYGKKLGERAVVSAITGGWIADEALIIWEENVDVLAPATLTLLDERQYGGSVIRLFRFKNENG